MLPKALLDALEQRTGYRKLLSEALDERVPGGASWAYVLGSATLILFLIQLGTGLVLAMFYSPSATDAWASVAYLERAVPAGALVRGIHHHAAGAMVVMAGLHLLQVVLWGAYKAPREGNWITGMMLLGLVLSFALTGYLLPWDQTGYWATKVATSIAGTVPVVGQYLQPIAQGGNDYGSLTLTRFYALHVIAFPIATLGLIGAHMYFFRRHGVTPSARLSAEQLARREESFWPKQVLIDAVFAAAVVGVLIYVAATAGAPLQAPADPSSNFIARPEWYFLFLFQLLKYFEGPLQVVGTVVIPGLASTFLLALPFIDRKPSRRIMHRLPFVGALAAGLVCIGGLTLLAVRHDAADPTIHAQKKVAAREAARARELAAQGVPPQGATWMMANDPLTRGERLFWRECASCHTLEGRAPKKPKAPDLTGYLSKAWLRQVLRDPDSHRLFGLTKVEGMKSFAKLPEAELTQLVDLLYQLRQPDLPPLEERPGAALLDTHECTDCHDFGEYYALEGPALFRYGSAEWIRKVVDDAGHEAFYGEANDMPAFETRLPEADRAAAVAFLLSLEGRAEVGVWPTVDDPGPVPTPRVSTSTAADRPEQ
ncbi:MAG: cytochrome b N-terminal domain-containing protein [Deltaproteobacteria bacterium]|nr:cytochrome b N-terminal domain-containing protein [Deltaproteobacteria bacterium]